MDETVGRGWRHPGLLLLYSLGAIGVSGALAVPIAGVGRHFGDWGEVAGALGGAAAFIAVFVAFRRLIERQPARELAPRAMPRELIAGIAMGLLLFSAVVAVIWAFGGYRVIGHNGPQVLVPVLAISIFSGVSEEIALRGYFFRLTEKWLGSWAALVLSAALFGALHLGNAHASLVAAVAIMLEAGIMLAALYMIPRRLWAAIGLHGAWNFAQGGIYGIPVSGIDLAGLLRPDMRGSDLLTGGAFGAEASLPAIVVATAFGIVLLMIAYRRGRFMAPAWRRGTAATMA